MRPICAQDAEAMTPEQKEQALATIATEQLVLDRKIAELVFSAHAEGLSGIELRSDTHPLAVLSLALVTVRPMPNLSPDQHLVTHGICGDEGTEYRDRTGLPVVSKCEILNH